MTLEHKSSFKSFVYICSNSQKCIVWVKIIDFSFMPKVIRILSKDHVPYIYFVNFLTYISKHLFLISNMYCKELNLDSFKPDFLNISIFFCPLRFQIFKLLYLSQILSNPNILCINGKLIYSACMWFINLNLKKLTLETGFVVQGHIYYWIALVVINSSTPGAIA